VGFGAARWLPRRGSLRPETDELVRIRNLFNPFVPMNDALGWLMSLNPRRFKRAEKAVLRLFDRPEGDRLRRLRGEVFLQPEGLPKSKAFRLAELSDGYQAMLAMAGEIAEITDPAWENLSDAEGLVLVDELEAHLHPRWKMRVVDSLRRAFPRMQFLASTHDPLCLRGLDAGEILVMRRDDEGQLFAFDELPGTEKMRVDQLLTSQLFGLGSTLDPETEKRFTEYYSLLGKRSRATEEQARFEELSATIGSRGMLGSSRRDRAIYHIVDEFLARREAPPQGTWLEMDEETKRKVLDLLEMAKVPP
jgi:hypothetical protein